MQLWLFRAARIVGAILGVVIYRVFTGNAEKDSAAVSFPLSSEEVDVFPTSPSRLRLLQD